MFITIYPPIGISFVGGRSHNEDAIFPTMGKAIIEDWFFMVCDGVGGHRRGDVASNLVCDKMQTYLVDHKTENKNIAFFEALIVHIQNELTLFVKEFPDAQGMATTLTLLYIEANCIWKVHMGDSRIYHIRGQKIMSRTEDHSYVGDLLRAGIINESEARSHPKKNVINRALQAHSNKEMLADIECITDIQANDYFFLCSDGVVESIPDDLLLNVLGNNESNSDKMRHIFKYCAEYSADNFSAYLLQIEGIGQSHPAFSETSLILDTDIHTISTEPIETEL